MDKFLKTCNFLRPNHEEIENRLITSKEINTVIKKTKQNKTPNKQQPSTEFHWQILWTFKEDLIPFLFKLFQKVEEEGRLANILWS